MKQKLYITGLITTALIVLGALFKINHLPGAGVLLVTGIVMLGFVFLPLALINNYKSYGEKKNPWLYMVTWLTCFIVFGGMLFKIMHWPGAGIMLILSLPFPYVVFLPVFLATTAKDKNFNIYNTVAVLCLLAGVSVFSALLALNVSKERIDDSLSLSRNYIRVEQVLDDIPSSDNQTVITRKIDNLLTIIDDYQSHMLACEGLTREQWKNDPGCLLQPGKTDRTDKNITAEERVFVPDATLENGLADLIQALETTDGYNELAKAVPFIFDYRYNINEPANEWIRQMLMSSPRSWSLIYLDALETNLKFLRAAIKS